jgi:hypothetical protein
MSITARTRIALAVAIVGVGTLVGAGVAGAQADPYVSPSSVVKPEVLNESAEKPAVASASTESSLAFTGGDAAGLALLGGVAVAAGTAITISRRRTVTA